MLALAIKKINNLDDGDGDEDGSSSDTALGESTISYVSCTSSLTSEAISMEL